MSTLKLFEFEDQKLRAFYLYDEIWFVAMDIAKILDYIKPDKMLNLVPAKDKKTINPHSYKILSNQFAKNAHKVCIVNEAGFYHCTFSSTKPQALQFTSWVTSEVLPSIRKQGYFSIEEFKIPSDMIEAVEELLKSLKAQNELIKQNSELETKLKQNEPLIDFSKKVGKAVNCVSFLQYAKAFGISRSQLMKRLRELKILMKTSTLPYHKYVDEGIFVVKEKVINTKEGTKVIPYTRITGKGQLYLNSRLNTQTKEELLWTSILENILRKSTRKLLESETVLLKFEYKKDIIVILGVKDIYRFPELQDTYRELYEAVYDVFHSDDITIEFETITDSK